MSGEDDLSRRYFKAVRSIVNIAWDLATGSDLSLPEVDGRRPILTRLSNGWAERILRAAEHDTFVAEVFASVTDVGAPPAVLMRPRFVWRVAMSRVEKHAQTRVVDGRSRILRGMPATTEQRAHGHVGETSHWSHGRSSPGA